MHVLQVDHDVGVGRGVPQRVVEEFGDDDRDRLDGVRDERGAGLEVVVHPHPVIPGEPGLAAGHRLHEVRLLTREPDPRPAHDGRDLRTAQRLLVLVVQHEQGLGQLGVVVTLLERAQGVLQPVQRGLDLTGGPAHPGLRGGIDAGALRGEFERTAFSTFSRAIPRGEPMNCGCTGPGTATRECVNCRAAAGIRCVARCSTSTANAA